MDPNKIASELEQGLKAEEQATARSLDDKTEHEQKRKLTYVLLIGLCAAGILFGITTRLAANSTDTEVGNETRTEISQAISDISEQLRKNDTQFSDSILTSTDIVTSRYAESLRKSAFIVLECGKKITNKAQYKKMLDLGDGKVKVELKTENDETVQLLMANENGWKIDSATCNSSFETII